MNEIEKNDTVEGEFNPIMMVVSPFSNIANRLKHFASGLSDESSAECALIHMDCFSREIDGSELKVIRFTDDNGMWSEIHPHDKVSGAILERGVSVNMYDLYNAIENCPDELITFWIDEEDNELVLNSFYNEEKGIDELEIRFKIQGTGVTPTITECESKKITSITMNAITFHTIMSELNVENNLDGVNIIVENGKLKYQADYNGFISELSIKQTDDEVYDTDVSIYIPMNIFQLMISTGHIYDLVFNLYDNDVVMLSTDDYEFYYRLTEKHEVYTFNEDNNKRYFIIDAELLESTMKLINRLNKQSNISMLTIEKVSDGEADLTCGIDGRYTISVRTDLAMLSDEKIEIDSDIFQEMVSRTKVDAIQLMYSSPTKLYMQLENQLIIKKMFYDHEKFSIFRKQKLIEWTNKND